ncbi:hypothetical protein FQA39_LY04720 [Lamprigera yunnana]|nr:hypothetical protein FQA39_LY04720 [Lamprigera yunnana]
MMLRRIYNQHMLCSVPSYMSISKFSTESEKHFVTEDKTQIAHFNNLKNKWWNENGDMKPLHSMNKLRIPLIRDGLINTMMVDKKFVNTSKPLQNLQILEVGSGGGILCEPLVRLGSVATGIDPAADMIEVAREHSKLDPTLASVTYIVDNIENHSKNNIGKYDAVIASEVLEHVNSKDVFLDACVKCLKPKGSIFITTLNQTIFTWVFGILLGENILNLVPKGSHEWEKLVQPHQVQRILEDCNCRTRTIHGMRYNFLTNKWSWITDTSISYALHAVKN